MTPKLDFQGAWRALFSAAAWFVLLTFVGAGLLIAGVFVLAGLGWSLIAGGVLCISSALFIMKGLTHG